MSGSESTGRITELLENSTLARLQRLRIQSRGRFSERHTGEHLAGSRGASNEFADYRDYSEGDDIRRVDWNIFARLHKPYIKLFYEEQEKHVVIIIDNSKSMDFEDKFLKAKQLALSFAFMGLAGGERVSLYLTNTDGAAVPMLRPLRGRGNLANVISFVESVPCGGDVSLETGIENALKHHTGQGIAVVLSDFLTFGDMKKGLNRLFNANLETLGLQILAPPEINPDLNGDFALIDSETEQKLDVSNTSYLLRLYREYRLSLEQELADMCRHRLGKFMMVDSSDDIDVLLMDSLRRKGWIA